MAINDKKNKVDEMGIRLAPSPMLREDAKKLPAVEQDFVLRPTLNIDEPDKNANDEEYSTANDYMPKRRDLNKHWKRSKRTKNILCGFFMFVFSAVVIVPYILACIGQALDFVPFKIVPFENDVVSHYINAYNALSANGFVGDVCAPVWKSLLPDFMLTFGLLFIIVNLIKSLVGIFGAIKVKKYVACSVVYVMTILAVVVAALIGAENFGINQISFVDDLIYGWQSSEYVGLLIPAVANLIVAIVCSALNREKSGYMN